jgi:DNA-binding GntR family transcriptional regulator
MGDEFKLENTWARIDVPPTIGESIYQRIKEAIIRGELKPGQKITERSMASIFNISCGPVREAFQKLSAENFITISARKEVHVAYSTFDEIKELIEFVHTLDFIAVKRAIKNMDDEAIDELKRMTNELGDLIGKDSLAFSEQNMKIHEKIWAVSGNAYLFKALSFHTQKLIILVNYFIFSKQPKNLSSSYKNHADLLEIFEHRNLRNAKKVIVNHWDWVLKYLT